MNTKCSLLAAVIGLMWWQAIGRAEEPKQEARNPFGVADVMWPDYKDVELFAGTVKLSGDGKDPNAAGWTKKTAAEAKTLEGEWSGRWNRDGEAESWSQGTAKIKAVGNRVYILYEEPNGGRYLIDAGRDAKGRLVGKYLNLNEHRDTYPWVGVVVDHQRIDGAWTGGRWDFRR